MSSSSSSLSLTLSTNSSSSSSLLLSSLLSKYPLSIKQQRYEYGTAGFRYSHSVLDGIMIRVGILVTVRGLQSLLLVEDVDVGDVEIGGRGVDVEELQVLLPPIVHVGVMITASHNTHDYNGVKVIDPNGGMMNSYYEPFATKLANERNPQKVLQLVQTEILNISSLHHKKKNQNQQQQQSEPKSIIIIHIGHDTRQHSPRLAQLVIQGIQGMMELLLGSSTTSVSIQIQHHGIVTTPLLHYLVLHSNSLVGSCKRSKYNTLPIYIPPQPTQIGYYDLLASTYIQLLATLPTIPSSSQQPLSLTIDCACGVGYLALTQLQQSIQRIMRMSQQPSTHHHHHHHHQTHRTPRSFILRNGPNDGPLNEQCGSEVVQKSQRPPKWWNNNNNNTNTNNESTTNPLLYAAAIDGDADRIVFFGSGSGSTTNENEFILLDGDQIACLICCYLQQLMNTLSSNSTSKSSLLSLGVVQTAYANGSSTNYLQSCLGKSNCKIAKTGVKHVHHMAEHELSTGNWNIAVYFEANGHGTVLFDTNYFTNTIFGSSTTSSQSKPQMTTTGPMTIKQYYAWQQLRLLPLLIHPTVGDALSDLLLVDFILQSFQWDIPTPTPSNSSTTTKTSSSPPIFQQQANPLSIWKQSLYQEAPSRQLKVPVPDRSLIQTNDNETKCLQPIGLQKDLDEAVRTLTSPIGTGRCFVRPSGTENVVRVYAEAATSEQANQLAKRAAQLVTKHCGTPPNVVPLMKSRL